MTTSNQANLSTVNVLRGIRTSKIAKEPMVNPSKKQFVRPFEDDYNAAKSSDDHEDRSSSAEDSKSENTALTALLNNNNNIVIPSKTSDKDDKTTKTEENSTKSENHMSKEKLKYLRYFRLGNRKRQGNSDILIFFITFFNTKFNPVSRRQRGKAK